VVAPAAVLAGGGSAATGNIWAIGMPVKNEKRPTAWLAFGV
jgi:hypothetical protein